MAASGWTASKQTRRYPSRNRPLRPAKVPHVAASRFQGVDFGSAGHLSAFQRGAKTRYPKYDRRNTTGIMRFLGRLYFVTNPLETQIGIRNNTNQPLEMQIAPNPPPVNADQAFKHHVRHLARRCFCHIDPDDRSPAPACRVSTPMRYNLSVIRDGWSPLILPFMRNTWVLG